MIGSNLPAVTEMYEALVARDAGYEGIFFVGVKTTGVFCRPTCAARKPRAENVEFFASSADALAAGYRPCKRCRPLELNGRVPDWLRSLLDRVERDPCRRWKDAELRALGVDPVRVRRWFKANHGITFQGYRRARRLGLALRFIREGTNPTD
ncbi:MAG: Ada metal-binding domain-containing protein, partial [Acidobacteriota bacterium]